MVEAFFFWKWLTLPTGVHDKQKDADGVEEGEDADERRGHLLGTHLTILGPATENFKNYRKVIGDYVCFQAARSEIPMATVIETKIKMRTPKSWWNGMTSWRIGIGIPGKK